MTRIQNRNCNAFLKSIFSRIKKFIGCSSNSVFYVAYPPLEYAEDIKRCPELFDPFEWTRETYSWFHEANAEANKANKNAGVVIAIVFERILQ
jgi:hypothetical protein